jgi:hypothetical protein
VSNPPNCAQTDATGKCASSGYEARLLALQPHSYTTVPPSGNELEFISITCRVHAPAWAFSVPSFILKGCPTTTDRIVDPVFIIEHQLRAKG